MLELLDSVISQYSKDHILKEVYKNKHYIFAYSFLESLEDALILVKSLDAKAYNDFAFHKLKAGKENSFDFHSLISSLCELAIMNSFILQSDNKESFKYEPQLRNDNKKNVEFSIEISSIRYNIEVKSPNMENNNKKLKELLDKHGVVFQYDARLLDLNDKEKTENLTSTDSKVKDFLVDANKKFPSKSGVNRIVNVLFICWNDNTDQPCTGLRHPLHGLLTKNSWYKNKDGSAVTFDNIDYIFVSDLYQNIIAHMLSGNIPLPGSLTGVPYFERNQNHLFPKNDLNPFRLPFSRNVLIKPIRTIIEDELFSLPIAFSDQTVDVIDEEYVSKHCNEIKIIVK